MLLTAMAMATTHVGLIATASTSYNDPYNLARRFASLDHISGGRAGWNIVTTATLEAARNFGLDELPAHAERYRRADEFVDVAVKLWDSWDDDAVLADKESGVWGDNERGAPDRPRRHPLPGRRGAQPAPLPAGSAGAGAGRVVGGRARLRGPARRGDLHRAADAGATPRSSTPTSSAGPRRSAATPTSCSCCRASSRPSARREAEARALEEELDRLIQPEYARNQLARTLRVAPERLALDEQLPDDLPAEDEIEGAKSRYTLIVTLARREQLTVRELIGRLGGGRGHRTFSGTPEQVADAIEEWFTSGAADGFNIMPPALPSGLETFVDHVVPILQARGLFRTEYTGSTLRDHYGLDRPSQHLFTNTTRKETA